MEISNVDSSSKVLLKTINQKLIPSLSKEATNLNWADILNNYSTAAKQLDILNASVIANQEHFSYSIVAPKNLLASEFTVPQLLSTMIPAEMSKCVIQSDKSFSVLSEDEEAEMHKLVETHNRNISNVVDGFSGLMEELRSGIAKEKGVKKRKLNA